MSTNLKAQVYLIDVLETFLNGDFHIGSVRQGMYNSHIEASGVAEQGFAGSVHGK